MFSSVRTARASAACHRIELHAAALYKVPADRQNGAPSRGNHLRHPAWQFRRHELRRVGCAVAEATCCFCAAGLRRAHCCNVVESTRTCCCVARTQAAARQLALSGSQASKPQRAALAIVGSSQAAATKGRSLAASFTANVCVAPPWFVGKQLPSFRVFLFLQPKMESEHRREGLPAGPRARARVVAPPMHAPSRAPLLFPLLLSHYLPFPRVH